MKKNLKSIVLYCSMFALLGIIIFSPWGETKLDASTSAGIVLTNIVQVTWDSGPISLTNNATNIPSAVGTNYGMTWIGLTNLRVISGFTISNDTFLTNDGNATADFILTFNSNITVNGSSVVWTAVYSNFTGGASGTTLLVNNISPAGGANIRFIVTVPGNETNGAFIQFQCMASNTNAVELGAGATNYVGFNTVAYGGNMGLFGAPPANAFLTNAQTDFTNWQVTALFADIILTKTAEISNAGPFVGNIVNPFPGAMITYRLDFTNKGLVAGSSVKIVDTLPTNSLLYFNGSLRKDNFGSTFANYGTAAVLLDTPGDDDGATNVAAADQLVFCPTNGIAPATGGTVDPSDAGAYYYRTYVK